MSGGFSLEDSGWQKFVSTGSVYDYLKYKDNIDSEKNNHQTILPDNRGGFCEDRSKRHSDQGSRT